MVYLLALASAVLYGAADFAGGLATRRAGTVAVVFLSQAAGLVLLALVLPLLPEASPSRSDLLFGAGAGLAGGIGVALLYRALALGRMAVVAPTTAVAAVSVPVLVAMFLGERPTLLGLAGIALAIVAILLVSQVRPASSTDANARSVPESGRSSGVGIALVSGVTIGFFLLFLAQTGTDAQMWPLVMARLVSVGLFGLVAFAGRHSLRMPPKQVALAVVCGVLDMLANVLYLIATWYGATSIVVTLASLYPASTVLLARILLGERLSLLQITGVGCALVAVVLIVRG